MAYVSENWCPLCVRETLHWDNVCRPCYERTRREKAAAWEALTVDEKLRDLKRIVDGLQKLNNIHY